ncbi:MAG: stage 0 sporulation family protein [bacterium]
MPRRTRPESGPPDPSLRLRPRREPPREIPEGVDLVMVRFKGNRKACYHNRRGIELQVGQYCIVEADRGRDLGRVTYVGPGKPEWWSAAQDQGVLQAAGAADLARMHENRGDEWGFYDICREKIQARKLKMQLVSVERQFDHKKITFYFTAEKRVDFRQLVRDLAAVFRTRIELRQIGVRDEARLKGGMGICGREFCCSSFLQDFVPVTLKMAKVQQLPLNPGKLSGPCGRLRCCMNYEHTVYQDLTRSLPKVGARVRTPEGPGRVRKLDLLGESCTVEIEGRDGIVEFPANKLKWERGKDDGPGFGGGDPSRCGRPRQEQ